MHMHNEPYITHSKIPARIKKSGKSQNKFRQSTIHAMSKNSSPDQKIRKISEQIQTINNTSNIKFFQPGLEIRRLTINVHVHNHNRISEHESIVHSTYKVKFFQPGLEIRRLTINVHVHNHNRISDPIPILNNTYNVKFFQPGSKNRKPPIRVAPHVHTQREPQSTYMYYNTTEVGKIFLSTHMTININIHINIEKTYNASPNNHNHINNQTYIQCVFARRPPSRRTKPCSTRFGRRTPICPRRN